MDVAAHEVGEMYAGITKGSPLAVTCCTGFDEDPLQHIVVGQSSLAVQERDR